MLLLVQGTLGGHNISVMRGGLRGEATPQELRGPETETALRMVKVLT